MIVAITDCRITLELEDALYRYADKIIKLPPFSRLPSSVASHPDMLMFIYGKRIFTWKAYLLEQPHVFKQTEALGYVTETIDETAHAQYPADVPLNCALLGKTLIANKKYVSKTLIALAEKENLNMIHTNQGYAKCSVAVVAQNAIITSDASIHTAAEKAGISVLKISSGHVRLDGYDTGFIGGGTGCISDTVLFCGDISTHPDAKKIRDFCRSHGKNAVSLTNAPLYDYGTVFFLQQN